MNLARSKRWIQAYMVCVLITIFFVGCRTINVTLEAKKGANNGIPLMVEMLIPKGNRNIEELRDMSVETWFGTKDARARAGYGEVIVSMRLDPTSLIDSHTTRFLDLDGDCDIQPYYDPKSKTIKFSLMGKRATAALSNGIFIWTEYAWDASNEALQGDSINEYGNPNYITREALQVDRSWRILLEQNGLEFQSGH